MQRFRSWMPGELRGLASAAAVSLVVLASLSACGPVEYISGVTRKASSEVAAAKSVDAQKWAPYHYTRAVEYLEKAREEASRADYQAANRFGRIAHDDATQAKKLSIARAKSGTLPGPLAPTKTHDTSTPGTSATPARDSGSVPAQDDEGADSEGDHSEGEIVDAPEAGGL